MWNRGHIGQGSLSLWSPYAQMHTIAKTILLIQSALKQVNVAQTAEEERARCSALDAVRLLMERPSDSSVGLQCQAIVEQLFEASCSVVDINHESPLIINTDYYSFLYQSILWICVALTSLATIPGCFFNELSKESNRQLRALIEIAERIFHPNQVSVKAEKTLNFTEKNWQWLWGRVFQPNTLSNDNFVKYMYQETSWALLKATKTIIDRNKVIDQLYNALKQQLKYFHPYGFEERYSAVVLSLSSSLSAITIVTPTVAATSASSPLTRAGGSLPSKRSPRLDSLTAARPTSLPADLGGLAQTFTNNTQLPSALSALMPEVEGDEDVFLPGGAITTGEVSLRVPSRAISRASSPPPVALTSASSPSSSATFPPSAAVQPGISQGQFSPPPAVGMFLPPPPYVRSQAASPFIVSSPLRRSDSMPTMHLTDWGTPWNKDANHILRVHEITKICTDPTKQLQKEINNCVEKFLQRWNNCVKRSIDTEFRSSHTNTRLSEEQLRQLSARMNAEDKRMNDDCKSYSTYCGMLSGVGFNTVFFKNYIDRFMGPDILYNRFLAQAQKVFYCSNNYILVLEDMVMKKISFVTPEPISCEDLPPWAAKAMVVFKHRLELLSNEIAGRWMSGYDNQLEIESLTQELENLQKNYKSILATHGKSIAFDLKRSLVERAPQAQALPSPILKAAYKDSAVIAARAAYLSELGALGEIASQLSPQSVPASPLASVEFLSRPASRELSSKRRLFGFGFDSDQSSRPSSAQSSDQTRTQRSVSQALQVSQSPARSRSSTSLASMPPSPARPGFQDDFSRMLASQITQFEKEEKWLYPPSSTGAF